MLIILPTHLQSCQTFLSWQRSVEMVLLIKDKTEARDFLKNRPPRNCREGFTIEGDQIYAGSDQRFYSAFQRNAKVLRGDVEAEIR